jgi:hypothetical protein
VQLSTEKYCSVAATLRPTAEIVSTWEIQEEPAVISEKAPDKVPEKAKIPL